MNLQYSFDPDSGLVYVADQSGESTKFVIDGLPIRAALGNLTGRWRVSMTKCR